jgi:cysteine-rich repeat protein
MRAAWVIVLLSGLAACSGDDAHDASGDEDAGDPSQAGRGGSSSEAGSGGSGSGGTGGGTPTGTPDSGTEDAGPAPVEDAGPDSSTPDTGATDPCEDVDDACDEQGTTCDEDTLVTCAEDEDGCLVETRTDCADGDTNYCDDDATPPACAFDPCADLDDACETEGVSCEGLNLVTCAENGDGCLVETVLDCTEDGDNNHCAEEGEAPACADDPCRDAEGTPKLNVCVEDATTCAENVLIECEDDIDGCPIATPTDCETEPGFNYCNAAAQPPACAFDACLEVTAPCLTAGVTCRENDLVTCAADGDGCLVETELDCTQNGTVTETCEDPAVGDADCVPCLPDPACAAVGTVEGDTSCNGNVFQTCTDIDRDTCLDLVTESCGDDFTCDVANGCEYSGDAECDSEIELVLREPGSFGMPPFDTAAEMNQFNNYDCPGLIIPFVAQGPDMLFALDVPAGQVTTVTLENPMGFTGIGAYMMVLASCEDVTGTQAETTCTEVANTSVSYTNETDATVRVYIAVDAESGNDGTFGLEVDTHPLGCGDGLLDGSEECDDRNIIAGDGCTVACELEEGYDCTAASPSICTRRPDDNICGNVMCPALPQGAGADLRRGVSAAVRRGLPRARPAGRRGRRLRRRAVDRADPREHAAGLLPRGRHLRPAHDQRRRLRGAHRAVAQHAGRLRLAALPRAVPGCELHLRLSVAS